MSRPDETINGVSIEAILNPLKDNPDLVERISPRQHPGPKLAIFEPDPEWFTYFQTFRSRILAAFEMRDEGGTTNPKAEVLSIEHVGSTSVLGLPAKAVIDIDLVLSSNHLPSDESFYVPRLAAAGFQFLLREPAWYAHRFFVASPPEPLPCNLHVWGPGCAEVERHRIFRDWLREHEDDRELYARTKREVAELSSGKGESMREYTERKDEVIQGILTRAFRELGYFANATVD